MAERKQCWECFRRRVVCDASRPLCKKCCARGVSCPGYGQKPLRWIAPGQTSSKQRGVRNPPTGTRASACEPTAVARSVDVCREVTELFQAAEYYNALMCPNKMATGAACAKNPFYMSAAAVQGLPLPVVKLLTAGALGHRILQNGDRPGSDSAVLATRLQTHRGAALRLVAETLAEPAAQTSNVTLLCVYVLLITEIQQSISPDWRHHLDGVGAIIQARGGLPSLAMSLPPFRHILRYVALIDIVGTTTAPGVEEDRARRQLELLPLLPALYGNGLDSCFPCPPDLLRDIILVNYLRSRLDGATTGHSTDRLPTALELLQRITQFSSQNWAAEIKMATRHDGSGDTGTARTARGASGALPSRTSSWDWQRLAFIYQAAVALYCISSLLGSEVARISELQSRPSYHETCIGVSQMRDAQCSALLRHLQVVAADTKAHMRKLVLWPMVLAGIEADPVDEASTRFIEHELVWLSSTLGTASPLVGRRFLQGLWRRAARWHDEQGQTWNGLFDRPYVFVV
ncbi:hypothetical protein TOPH_05269 [Tolypocladium ophioglossoides CBS 100239]|uniref:Zn(2)-C6 fungal-type domain-containing protein n=1 Tax=Tolypocladium ophioglossoides (strain CBS 100239) TaxID=1163406 RepID=A0A0L0N851_TOLOC|nr:hypothetical protein TOPH_05269 [Tolypocladium ophioglossoides CBS 100239]